MFIFGHIGITLGIFLLLKKHPLFSKLQVSLPFIAFGVMLPDLIDKPIGEGILADAFSNGRIYAHTLFFCLLLSMMALYYYRKRKDDRVLTISAATFLHLMEDRMWQTPQTLFWPLMGLDFPQGNQSSSLLDYFLRVLTSAYTKDISYAFISEITGILILSIVGIRYLQSRSNLNQ